MPIISKTMTL